MVRLTWRLPLLGSCLPPRRSTCWISDVPYAAYAELLGLTGIRCTDPEEVGGAWDRALGADSPVVLEFVVDPNVGAAREDGAAGQPVAQPLDLAAALEAVDRCAPGDLVVVGEPA